RDWSSDVCSSDLALEEGKYLLIEGFYHTGLSLLHDIHKYLNKKLPNKTFQEQRAYRLEYHRLSNLILLEIVDHKLVVRKSPSIGWLRSEEHTSELQSRENFVFRLLLDK